MNGGVYGVLRIPCVDSPVRSRPTGFGGAVGDFSRGQPLTLTLAMNPFTRATAAWYPVGYASEFPSIDDDARIVPRCKAFKIPRSNGAMEQVEDIDLPGELKDQVLVFKFKGKYHAIDHQCPHSSFPLSRGNLFDIEDFGVVLSAGLTCPKHGWSFDIFSGRADRGNYQLKVWEVELRDSSAPGSTDQEVWVRRKQRIG